jgi:hypothetical protein
MAIGKRRPCRDTTGSPSTAMSSPERPPISIQKLVAELPLMIRSRTFPPGATRSTTGSS